MHKFIANIKRNGKGFFALKVKDNIVGQMTIDLNGNELKILHTTAFVSTNSYSFGDLILQKIVEYARMHELKIITLSRFAGTRLAAILYYMLMYGKSLTDNPVEF